MGGRHVAHRSDRRDTRRAEVALLAITIHYQGRSNGMIAAAGIFASLVPEAPPVAAVMEAASSSPSERSVSSFRRNGWPSGQAAANVN
jgi:hypothetical protein